MWREFYYNFYLEQTDRLAYLKVLRGCLSKTGRCRSLGIEHQGTEVEFILHFSILGVVVGEEHVYSVFYFVSCLKWRSSVIILQDSRKIAFSNLFGS